MASFACVGTGSKVQPEGSWFRESNRLGKDSSVGKVGGGGAKDRGSHDGTGRGGKKRAAMVITTFFPTPPPRTSLSRAPNRTSTKNDPYHHVNSAPSGCGLSPYATNRTLHTRTFGLRGCPHMISYDDYEGPEYCQVITSI